MSDVQRVIKYIAIAFAIYLIVNIIGWVVFGLGSLFMMDAYGDAIVDMKEIQVDNKYRITDLEIDIKGSSLVIKESDTFKIETNNKYVEVKQNKEELVVKEKSHHWFSNNGQSKVVISIPENTEFDKIKIEAGAGKIEIVSLIAKDIDLKLGAGKAEINYLKAMNEVSIDGGAGEFIIDSGSLNNLDFEVGVGHASVMALVLGNSKIEAGVGKLDIELLGRKEDYRIRLEKGLGSIYVDGENVGNNVTYGDGVNEIKLEGGVGSIDVDFVYLELSEEDKGKTDTTPDSDSNEFTKTYKLLNKTSYNEENSYYLTLQLFQGEVDTVIVKDVKDNLIEGKNYEFTFLKDENVKLSEDTIKEIFNNYKLMSIRETAKNGLDQRQDKIN